MSGARTTQTARWRFWWRHEWPPLLAFLLLVGVIAVSSSDILIAHALFFDSSSQRWIGAGSWWVNDVAHVGGRWFVRSVVAATLVVWIAACIYPALRRARRPAAYFSLAVILSVGVVGLLKLTTHIDCPWSLTEFGGHFPYVPLFGERLDAAHHGRCFPAAHASTGYTLLALYFVFLERHAVLARLGLVLGIGVGLIFGITQQSRGAHFASHDVWSAFLVWTISLTVYTFAFDTHLWD